MLDKRLNSKDADFFESSRIDWTSIQKDDSFVYSAFIKNDLRIDLLYNKDIETWRFAIYLNGRIHMSEPNVEYSSALLAYITALEETIKEM